MDDNEMAKDPFHRIKNLVYLLTSEPNYSIFLEEAEKENAKLAKMPVVMGARMHTAYDFFNEDKALSADIPRDLTVSESSLDYLLKRSASEVGDLLGFSHCFYAAKGLKAESDDYSITSIYNNTVNPAKIDICYADMTMHVLPPTMAHEYVHFLQDAKACEFNDYIWDFKPLMEGFGRGVERIVAEKYAAEKDDMLYLVRTQERVCTDIHDFVTKVIPEQKAKWKNRFVSFDGHWGTAAFLVLERKFGRGIYKEMINSNKPYEMMIEMLGGKR